MNWILNRKKPAVNKASTGKDLPDDLWEKCAACSSMQYRAELVKNHYICSTCGHHFRLPVLARMEMLFDKSKYTLIQLPKVKEDPLHFQDLEKYTDRLKKNRKKTKNEDAICVAHGKIGKHNAVVGVMDFNFMAGSMGTAVGEAIITAAKLATLQEAALILVTSSGGARMQEGILSLMQMARTTIAVDKVKAKKLPYITVLADPTTGGVTASFAMLGDVAFAEPGAIIGFAGRRVIEQTTRTKLPENFQKAEYLLDHGMIDQVVNRLKLRDEIIKALNLLHK